MPSRRLVALWILVLSFAAVGVRNFERGLPVDGPLYASIARDMVRTGEWVRLDAAVPDFRPFHEHPHLGLWMIATVFSVFPADDWSGRIPGHLCYIAFLALMYAWVRRRANERAAFVVVALLVGWARFTNFFSAIYLDPPTLLFGALAVFLVDEDHARPPRVAALAGVSLALAGLTKGLTILGFGPALVLIGVAQARRSQRATLVQTAAFVGGFAAVAILYRIALRIGGYPDFLADYWARQVQNRFEIERTWWGLVSPDFWGALARDTYGAVLLVPLALGFRAFRRASAVPIALLAGFVLLYAPNGRVGWQYWLMLMPWIAWSAALVLAPLVRFRTEGAMRILIVIGVVGAGIVQYLPTRTHGNRPPELYDRLRPWAHERRWLFHSVIEKSDFVQAAGVAWYADLRVDRYLTSDELARRSERGTGLIVRDVAPATRAKLATAQWCEVDAEDRTSIWLPCR